MSSLCDLSDADILYMVVRRQNQKEEGSVNMKESYHLSLFTTLLISTVLAVVGMESLLDRALLYC